LTYGLSEPSFVNKTVHNYSTIAPEQIVARRFYRAYTYSIGIGLLVIIIQWSLTIASIMVVDVRVDMSRIYIAY